MNKLRSMKMVVKNIVLVGFFLASSQLAQAQSADEVDGEVQDAEILIEKERKIELSKEVKLYEFIKWKPERITPVSDPSDFKWYIYDVANEPMQFEPAKATVDQKGNSYQHYGKLGFGNYASPLVDVSLNSLDDPNRIIGLNVKHESFGKGEVDDENSASAASEVNLYGALIGEQVKLESAINYRLENNYYYGYPTGTVVDKTDIKHNGNFLNIGLSGRDMKSEDSWAYQAALNFKHYSDNFEAKENTLAFDLTGSYEENIYLDTEVRLSGYKDTGIDESRAYFRLNPYYRLMLNELTLDIGLSFSVQNDDLPDLSSSKIFPFAKARYALSPEYSVFAQLDGGYTFNSLYAFATDVGILNQSVGIANSERLFDLSGGISGKPADRLSVSAEVGFQSIRYLPILVNNVTDQSRMDITYDVEESKVFTFKGVAQYEINDQHQVSAGLNLFGYSSDGYDQIYHRPTSKLLISGDHQIIPKLNAKWNFTLINGIVGQDLSLTDVDVALDPILKLDLGLHYQIKEQWGIFLSGENLINKNYSRYLHYPQRGIQIKVGATFRL
ncbi:MAG: TonB-dependent receptor [Reichenbachiella sp.]|uniref:TonB-dependent receptor n=1 Tax=Reichenbachiella sp. TaxID=2184521 RepID=UPI0032999E90